MNDKNEPEQDTEGEPLSMAEGWDRLSRALADFWQACRAQFMIKVYGDDDEPEEGGDEAEVDYHPTPAWKVLLGWCVVIAAVWAVYYFYKPVHRVVDTTTSAARNSINRELNPPPAKDAAEELTARIESSIQTVLPQENRGEVYGNILRWLQIRRPNLDLRERLDEIDVIDHLITEEVRCTAYHNAQSRHKPFNPKESPLRIRRVCVAGDPDKPWLVLSLARDDPDADGMTFAILCDGGFYDCIVLNEDKAARTGSRVVQRGDPWLTSADLDGDGSDEIIETWRSNTNRELSVQVHKLLQEPAWVRVMSVAHAYVGQVRITRPGPSSAAQLVIAEGVAPEEGQSDGLVVTYLVSSYSWDRKLGTLKKTNEHQSDREFDPSEAYGRYITRPKKLPDKLKKTLNGQFRNGWMCISARSVYGYMVLSVVNAEDIGDADASYVMLADKDGRICLAASGAIYNPGGLYTATDLDGDGRLEVVLEVDGGGAHGNLEYCVCDLYPKFRLLAHIYAGRGSIESIKDLGRDGRKEIVMWDDCFDQFDDMACADTPLIPQVLRYRDGRYVNATGEYPHLVRADMADARNTLRRSLSGAPDMSSESPNDSLAIRWLADAALIGKQDSAYAEMIKIAPPLDLGQWLARNRTRIVSVARSQGSRVSYEVPQLD